MSGVLSYLQRPGGRGGGKKKGEGIQKACVTEEPAWCPWLPQSSSYWLGRWMVYCIWEAQRLGAPSQRLTNIAHVAMLFLPLWLIRGRVSHSQQNSTPCECTVLRGSRFYQSSCFLISGTPLDVPDCSYTEAFSSCYFVCTDRVFVVVVQL